MSFDGRDLRAFLAVVDCGSLGRAAHVVNMTQPSLSRRIQEMELRLGSPLFERHSKGMALTAAGEALIDHARLLVFEMEQAEQAVAALNGMQRGRLRLGAVAALCRGVVPRAIAAMLRDAPEIIVDLFEAPDSELVDALVGRRLDLIVATDGLEHDEMIAIAPCRVEDRFVPCSRVGNPRLDPASTDLDALLDCSWVMLGRGRTPRLMFEELLSRSGRKLPRIAVETNSIGAQIAMVANSDMLGWLPMALVAGQVDAGLLQVHSIPELVIERSFQIYRRRRAILAKPAQLVLDHLAAAMDAPG
ncbi:LysR family transcriptional regulator [Sphingomonas oligophenolica]|uniref:LysR family transcriptional regulator n=1 Tax=Sphingomonas oligophenolica TaxID=301154 RepID=A0ABU9XYB8_9SPHN